MIHALQSDSGPDQELGTATRSMKVAAGLISLGTVPALILGFVMIQSGRSSLHDEAVARFRVEADSRTRAVEEFFDAVQLDLVFLSRSQTVRELAVSSSEPISDNNDAPGPASSTRGHEDAVEAAKSELLSFSSGRRAFYQVRYISEHGREVVRLNVQDGRALAVPNGQLQDKSSRYYVKDALSCPPGLIYASRMDVNVERGEIEEPRRSVVRFAVRVADSRGIPRGALVLNIDADYVFSLLGKLPRDTEAWLLDESDNVLGMAGADRIEIAGVHHPHERNISEAIPGIQLEPLDSASLDESSFEGAGRLFWSSTLLPAPERPPWRILMTRTLDSIDAPVRSMTTHLLLLLLAVVALAASAGAVVARRLSRAAARLAEARAELRSVNTSLEAEVERRTEEVRTMERGLTRVDKLASIGQLTAGVLHEVGNPLAAIKTKIQVEEEDDLRPDRLRPLLSEIVAEVDRLSRFLRSFARFGQVPPACRRAVRTSELVKSAVSLLKPELGRRALDVQPDGPTDEQPIFADPDQFRQLLVNLVLNAAQSKPRSGAIRIRWSEEHDRSGPSFMRIAVEDDGAGIPAELHARLFDPFFTTQSEGSGLGLAICKHIIRDHDGRIDLESEVGRGTTVTVRVPLAKEREESAL